MRPQNVLDVPMRTPLPRPSLAPCGSAALSLEAWRAIAREPLEQRPRLRVLHLKSSHDTSSNLVRLPQDIFKKASAYFDKKEVKKINLAYCVALEAHEGQLRRDGSPYISHPVEVASILLGLKVDLDSVCAGFMHDVLEDCDVQKTTLEKMFGKDVVSIIDGVSKLNKMDFKNIAERNAGSFQKMALAMSKDIRVILVKL